MRTVVLGGAGKMGCVSVQDLAGRKPGRQSSDEVIVYMALGIWGEYAAILPEVYRQARALGLGQRLRAGGTT